MLEYIVILWDYISIDCNIAYLILSIIPFCVRTEFSSISSNLVCKSNICLFFVFIVCLFVFFFFDMPHKRRKEDSN
jgi:hypothetical protein